MADSMALTAFAKLVEKKVGDVLKTKLDGTFKSAPYPSGFNYALRYGNNGYYNEKTLETLDLLIATQEDGQLTLTENSFSGLYDKVLTSVDFKLSTQDQEKLAKADTAAAAYVQTVLKEFTNAGFKFTDPPPEGGKLQDIFDQLETKYGTVEKIPVTFNSLRSAIINYKAKANASYVLHSRWGEATLRVNAAKDAIEAPTDENGGEQIGEEAFYVGYTRDKLPSPDRLLKELDNTKNQIKVTLTISNFSGNEADLQIDGSPSVRVNLGWLLRFEAKSKVAYDLSTFTRQSSSLTISLTYQGITIVSAQPTALTSNNQKGWYDNLILKEVLEKTGKDVTGYQLVGGEFDVKELFGPGKQLGRLKTYVISQPPVMEISAKEVNISSAREHFVEKTTFDVSLFGIFSLDQSSQSYEVRKVSYDEKSSSFSASFSGPGIDKELPSDEQVAYVLGGVPVYPPTNL
jgi:hypothetical protein